MPTNTASLASLQPSPKVSLGAAFSRFNYGIPFEATRSEAYLNSTKVQMKPVY